MVVSAIAAVGLTVAVSYFASKVALGFGRDVRRSLFVHVENFSLQAFDKIGTASLITRSTNDVKIVQDVLNMVLKNDDTCTIDANWWNYLGCFKRSRIINCFSRSITTFSTPNYFNF